MWKSTEENPICQVLFYPLLKPVWFSEFLSVNKDDIFNFKLLMIIFISQENPLFPPFSLAHQQREYSTL